VTDTTVRTCDECERPAFAKGLCSRHYDRRRYWANPEKHRERAKKWHHDNRDRALERLRQRDREPLRAASRRWYRDNRLKAIASAANLKAKRLGLPGVLTASSIAARLAYFGGRCWVCGVADADTIDHVKQMSLGGANWPANIRPACMSCNTRRNERPVSTGGVSFL
jgi:5-methylcytosine-specific restriction endonuclease McrA